MVEHDLIQSMLRLFQFLHDDLFSRTFHPSQRLMNHDVGIRQRISLAGGSGRQQKGAHRCRVPHAIGCDIACDELHGVVNRQSATTLPPGELM